MSRKLQEENNRHQKINQPHLAVYTTCVKSWMDENLIQQPFSVLSNLSLYIVWLVKLQGFYPFTEKFYCWGHLTSCWILEHVFFSGGKRYAVTGWALNQGLFRSSDLQPGILLSCLNPCSDWYYFPWVHFSLLELPCAHWIKPIPVHPPAPLSSKCCHFPECPPAHADLRWSES